MSDTDTNTIDEKKEQNNSSGSSNNNAINMLQSFLTSLIYVILFILFYFSSSSLLLFICKLAQTNVLPTDANCAPYTDNKPNISKIKTNIFTTNTDPEMSMKLEIPYEENSFNTKYKIIQLFKRYKEQPSSNFLANYFISIIENLMQFDYSAINTSMNLFNGLPEYLIVGIGPILAFFLFSISILINGLYFIYLWFANMYWFFKKNKNDTGVNNPKWEDVTIGTPVDYGLAIACVILFAIVFFMAFPILSFIPFLILCFCICSCLMYKGLLNGKNITSFTLIKEVLKYYKLTIVSLISFFVVVFAFSKLGVYAGMASVMVVLLIYYGMIGMNIFKAIPETHLSPIVSNEQATKSFCPTVGEKKEKHGFLYNLLLGQKGGNITKELKKINKTFLHK
jgi:hypothetical protein